MKRFSSNFVPKTYANERLFAFSDAFARWLGGCTCRRSDDTVRDLVPFWCVFQFFTDAGQYVVRFGDTSFGSHASGAPAEGEERGRETGEALPPDPRTLESAQRVGTQKCANAARGWLQGFCGNDCQVSVF